MSFGGVVTIAGATATGKTTLAVALAGLRGDIDLVNADSRQVLRGLRVATFAPTAAELRGVPSHLFAVANPGENFTVASWVALARPCVAAVAEAGRIPCVVGGTGLYVRALVNGWMLGSVPADPEQRARREALIDQPDGLQALVVELARRDPQAVAAIDRHNPRRVVRALEMLDAGRVSVQSTQGLDAPVTALQLGLDVPRDRHRDMVAARIDRMFDGDALVGEVTRVLGLGVSRGALDRAGIGYREALALMDGRLTLAAAKSEVLRRTLRYAKAQRTWFRGDGRMAWLEWRNSPLEVLDEAAGLLSSHLARG